MRLGKEFYKRDALDVAHELPGKKLVMRRDSSSFVYIINEVEAYRGIDDLACHASKGRTPRTEIMFHEGGHIYMYFIYGMYWMFNIVTGEENQPHAVLVRGLDGIYGPGKLCRELGLDRSFYGESLISSDRIWLEEGEAIEVNAAPRIGVGYAGEWADKPWRFFKTLSE